MATQWQDRGKRMRTHTVNRQVRGPWSLATSREFWEGFTPAALGGRSEPDTLSTVYRVEADWSRAEAKVTQRKSTATIVVTGGGDLGEAAQPWVFR